MRLDVEAIKANDPAHSGEIFKLCTHIAGVTARKNHVHEYADDMAQDLVIIVLTRLPEIYDGVSEIDAWVWEAARRMTKGYKRRARREVSGEGDDEGEGLVARTADETSPTAEAWAQGLIVAEEAAAAKADLIKRITERAERQQLARSSAGESGPAAEEVVQEAKQKPWFIDRSLRPRREGWIVRRQLGLTQNQMSELLGVSVNRYREREKAGSIPALWKAKGRELLKENRKLPESDGPKLVKRWLMALGLESDDTTTLARRIGVHRATVYRWSKGKSHPQGAAIMHIEAIVEAACEVTRERTGRNPGARNLAPAKARKKPTATKPRTQAKASSAVAKREAGKSKPGKAESKRRKPSRAAAAVTP